MGWKTDWRYKKGNVQVTVQAEDENEKIKKFDFTCYLSDEVSPYDRLDNLADIAHHMALLRNYYHGEIIDIKEIK